MMLILFCVMLEDNQILYFWLFTVKGRSHLVIVCAVNGGVRWHMVVIAFICNMTCFTLRCVCVCACVRAWAFVCARARSSFCFLSVRSDGLIHYFFATEMNPILCLSLCQCCKWVVAHVNKIGIVHYVDSSCMVKIGIVGIKVTRLWFNPGMYETFEEMQYSQYLHRRSRAL
jgi:hypothetical protein